MKEIKIIMPAAVKEIIDTLENAGFEAFAVGGCVRDAVLGRVPADWDITTSAMPAEVKQLFHRTIDTGIQHGTVTVMVEHIGYEVTTYRIDGEYEDARHPKEVSFTSNLVEDLKRRDFTINAMAYNDRVGIVDQFDGISDLKKGVIRCVGNPYDRFGEDALRMLRAVRFSAQLGFEIDKETNEAISQLAQNLKKISAERIQTELVKLLVSDHPDYLEKAYTAGITAVILPEFDLCMKDDTKGVSVGRKTLKGLLQVENDKVLRLTMLFHDLGKHPDASDNAKEEHAAVSAEIAKGIMRRLKFDNDTTDKVKKLTAEHAHEILCEPAQVRCAVSKIGKELFPYFLKIQKAVILTGASEKGSMEVVQKVSELYDRIIKRGDPVCIKDLAVDGKDLIAVGVQQGKKVGEILNGLLQLVLEDPAKNKKEILLAYVCDTFLENR